MKVLFLVVSLLVMYQGVVADMDVDLSKVDQSFLDKNNCKSIEQLKIKEYLKSKNYKKIVEISGEIIDADYVDDYLLYYHALAEYKLGNYNQSMIYLDLVLSAKSQCNLTNLLGGAKENKDELRDFIIYFNLSEILVKMDLKSFSIDYSFYAKKRIIDHLSYQYGYTEKNIGIMNRILEINSFKN